MDFIFFKTETSMMQKVTISIKMALIAKVADIMNRESTFYQSRSHWTYHSA
jgi:hypothetical protein